MAFILKVMALMSYPRASYYHQKLNMSSSYLYRKHGEKQQGILIDLRSIVRILFLTLLWKCQATF